MIFTVDVWLLLNATLLVEYDSPKESVHKTSPQAS